MLDSLTTHQNRTRTTDGFLKQIQSSFTPWFSAEHTPYALPKTHQQQLALHLEPEAVVGNQKHRKSISDATIDLFDSEHLEYSDWRHPSASLTPKLWQSKAQKSTAQSNDRDMLTGLHQNQAIAGQTANTLTGYSFNSAYGYGLVNAAKAVAWASGYYPYSFADVRDWGGSNWNNDRVKAPEVWSQGITGQGVTVAVIDSGVDIFHPDLNDNIWRNAREVAGDGIDNDWNGYVDDLYGWNFGVGENNNNILPGTTNPGQSHGTHVAGTIAAELNQFGTTGVAPNAKIMTLRLGNTSGTSFTNGGDLAQAIYYAVNNGAKVINMSLGWTETPDVVNALAYAASRNVITVSASGNLGQPSPGFPAKYATHYGISVGAIDYYGNLASFSNRAGLDSRMQHIVAPGVDILSTVPSDQGWYKQQSGTSMAAPHVTGVVALMLSANSNLTHAQVQYILTQSAMA